MRGTKPHLSLVEKTLEDTEAPEFLSDAAKAEWRRVMPVLNKRRILTDADIGGLENYCVAIGTVREMEAMLQVDGYVVKTPGGPKKHPAVAIRSAAIGEARLLAAELGLTPVSRSRPSVREESKNAGPDLFNFV